MNKVLLTIHFVNAEFMLAFIRDSNTASSLYEIFEDLYWLLGLDDFKKLFPVILADNGTEFSDPTAIEYAFYGNKKITISIFTYISTACSSVR